jgi:transposase InsO family protein
LHHSDQGSQSTSGNGLRLLEEDQVVLSTGDVGRCSNRSGIARQRRESALGYISRPAFKQLHCP